MCLMKVEGEFAPEHPSASSCLLIVGDIAEGILDDINEKTASMQDGTKTKNLVNFHHLLR